MGKHGAAATTEGEYPSRQRKRAKRANQLKHRSRNAKRAAHKLENQAYAQRQGEVEILDNENLAGYSEWDEPWDDFDYRDDDWSDHGSEARSGEVQGDQTSTEA
uniref:Uncharacterized protein n=1 Tax=Chlamydomonas leiostraca TaxID=1034604 RepID=A0A7S0RC84_9CHLO